MATLVAALAIICAAILAVNADMYLQNPRYCYLFILYCK